MIGLLWPGSGRRVRTEKTVLAGLRLLRAEVCGRRGLDRACRVLARSGVRRVLLHRGLEGAALPRGLAPIDPGLLYRHMAHRLVLAALDRRDIPPERAVVEVRGGTVNDDVCRAAARLCVRVGQVRICAGPGSARVQESLLRTFGMAADPAAPADLTLRMDGPDGGEELYLAGPRLRTGGAVLAGPEPMGEELEVDGDSLLCALWQAGLVAEHNILIVY